MPAYAPFVESDPAASASLAAHEVAGNAHEVILATKASVAALQAEAQARVDAVAQEAAERVAAVQAEADARIAALATKVDDAELAAHTTNVTNPHAVTKVQVGLPNADNTTDADKPVSVAQQAVLNVKADLINGVIPTSQVPLAGRHRAGRWYSTLDPIETPVNAVGPNNGLVRYTPFWVPEEASFDALAVHIMALSANGTIYLGAYVDDGGYPGAAIVRDLAGISLSASLGSKEVLLPIPAVRGLIWLANLSMGQSPGNAIFQNLSNPSGSYRHPIGHGTSGHYVNMDSRYSGTAAVLPDVAPAGMGSTWQTSVIYIRAS